MHNKIRAVGALVLAILWAALTAFTWFSPAKESSDSERRLLNQMPELTKENLLSGRFAEAFEKYANDQFPARDAFRSIKAVTHQYALQQLDNNDIYLTDGYGDAPEQKPDYPVLWVLTSDGSTDFCKWGTKIRFKNDGRDRF